ncbi:MAG TPA: DUF5052 family protein [Firmicutes bacterium]|nr:DUF5052 family protein [Bacillota bacterium]
MKSKYWVFALLVVALVGISLVGCKSWERTIKDWESSVSGLNRTITVYSNNGDIIKTYQGKIDIETNEYGNKVKFDVDGKRIIIYNAIVIVDED